MSLVLIKTFLTIVETGSLVKASRKLNITQSTVTSRLKSLEDDVGQALIYRQKSGIVLTSPGIKFHRYAEAMSNMWQQALIETSLPKGMESICNLGCDPDLWPGVGRNLVRRIRQNHPTTALTFQQATSTQLADQLAIGIIDAAISYKQTILPNMTTLELAPERLELFSTAPHTPVRGDPNYTYFDAGPEFGSQHAAAYSDAGIAKHTFGSARWVLDFLQDNGGSAYLPTQLASDLVDQGKLFKLDNAPDFIRRVFLITNDTTQTDWKWLHGLVGETG